MIGIHSPAILRSALHATIIAVADPIKSFRICNRQRAQHYGMNQSKDRRGSTDPQRQSEHGSNGENGRHTELPDDVTKITKQVRHSTPLVVDEYATRLK